MKPVAKSSDVVQRAEPPRIEQKSSVIDQSARNRVPNTLSSPLSKLKKMYEKLNLELGGLSMDDSDLLLEMRQQSTALIRQIEHINDLITLRSEMSNEKEREVLLGSTTRTPDDIIYEEALDLAQVYQRLSDISINLHTVPVHINSGHLRKLVRELIDNALRYSEEGDKVEVTSELSETHIIIQVRDGGEGLLENQTEALNDRRRISSSGLGLVIVNELLELYHGELSFFSIPCRVTAVRVSLPRLAEDE